MSGELNIDLECLARQQREILGELGIMRDDVAVLLAIVMRIDGTVSGLVQEVRALHSQHSRLANRVTALEKAAQTRLDGVTAAPSSSGGMRLLQGSRPASRQKHVRYYRQSRRWVASLSPGGPTRMERPEK
jgi:hypothetical protein